MRPSRYVDYVALFGHLVSQSVAETRWRIPTGCLGGNVRLVGGHVTTRPLDYVCSSGQERYDSPRS